MAQQPVYIEVDEELTEVVERIRRNPGSEVAIVVPPHSRLGQSRFNFQLLREYAGRMGKRVAIISSEPAVQALATEHGFQAYASVDRYFPVGEDVAAPPAPAPAPAPSGWGQQAGSPAAAPEPAYASAAVATPIAPAPRPAPMPAPQPQPRPGPAAKASRPMEGFLDRDILGRAPNRSLLYGGAALVLIVGLVAMFLFVPSATVTLTAQAQAFSQALDVQAAPGAGPVAIRVADDNQQLSQQIKTTGLHVTPAQPATGQVVYTNSCTGPFGGDLSVPDGQRLDGGGQQFAQQGSVTVPQGGTATANIIGTVPGVASNVPANTITTIEPDQGIPPPNCLSVTNPSATTGGAEKKQDPMLSQQDFDGARQALTDKLKQKIHDDLAGQVQKGERLDDTVNYDTPSFLADHKVGDLVAQFTGSMTLKGEGAFYSDKDVRDQLRQNLVTHVPAGDVTTDNNVQTDYQITQSQPGGHLTFHGTANAYIAPRLDFEQIKSQLAGKSGGSAQSFLRSLHVLSYKVDQTPFPLPFLPLLTSRITVKYVVEQGSTTTT